MTQLRASRWGIAAAITLLLAAQCRRSHVPTYYEDVAPIIAARCVHCHRDGGVARVPRLQTYDQVAAAAGKLKLMVQTRNMPPWGADNTGLCRTWKHALWLDPPDVRTLVEWAGGSKLAGDAAQARPIPPPEGLPFSPSNVTLDVGGPYTPGLGPAAYRCFIVDPQFAVDHLATAFRVVSSDPRSVAQVTLYALDSEHAEMAAAALDGEDAGLGYRCYGSPRVPDSRLVMSWTWDGSVLRLPPSLGIRFHAHRKAVLQIHYDVDASGLDAPTRTHIDLEIDDRAREASYYDLSPDRFELAPAKNRESVHARFTVPKDLEVFGAAPRMHTLGKTMQLDIEHAGRKECAANFDHWHFYRQRLFEYAERTTISAGDALSLTCIYDTRGETQPIPMGEDIVDEECRLSLLVAE